MNDKFLVVWPKSKILILRMIPLLFRASLICRDKRIILRDQKQRRGFGVNFPSGHHIICRNIWIFIYQSYSIARVRFSRCARIQISNYVDFDLFYETLSLVIMLGQLSYSPKKGQQLAREFFCFLSTEKYLIRIHNSNITRGVAITAKQRRSGRFLFWK